MDLFPKRFCHVARALLLPGTLAGLFTVVGCGPSNTFVPPPPPEVEVLTMTPADRTAFESFPAVTTAPEFAEVRARVKGFLESVDFVEGGDVTAGQILFQIEPAPFQAELDKANADLATAQANLELANQNYTRNYELYQKKAISDLDVLKYKAELDKAKASVDLAKANAEAKRLDLSYATVKAPFAGRASERLVSVGNLVGGGENTLLTTVVQDDPMYVNFEINERDVVNYITGDHATKEERPKRICWLKFADGQAYGPEGELTFVDNRVDSDTGTLRMRATFPNPDDKLVPGLFVRVLFPQAFPAALAVPANVIQKDLGGDFVLVVGKDDVVEQRYVTPGPRVEGDRIILSGLEAGERVVVRGVQKARDGAPVRPVAASPDLPAATEVEPAATPE
jgi:RND family efflux transporter MFP subunit